MTIEIEAGASQPQCSMKRSCRPLFFDDVFDQFVLNNTSKRVMTRASHFKMRVRGALILRKRFGEALVSLTEHLEPFNNCSTMNLHATHVRKD